MESFTPPYPNATLKEVEPYRLPNPPRMRPVHFNKQEKEPHTALVGWIAAAAPSVLFRNSLSPLLSNPPVALFYPQQVCNTNNMYPEEATVSSAFVTHRLNVASYSVSILIQSQIRMLRFAL